MNKLFPIVLALLCFGLSRQNEHIAVASTFSIKDAYIADIVNSQRFKDSVLVEFEETLLFEIEKIGITDSANNYLYRIYAHKQSSSNSTKDVSSDYYQAFLLIENIFKNLEKIIFHDFRRKITLQKRNYYQEKMKIDAEKYASEKRLNDLLIENPCNHSAEFQLEKRKMIDRINHHEEMDRKLKEHLEKIQLEESSYVSPIVIIDSPHIVRPKLRNNKSFNKLSRIDEVLKVFEEKYVAEGDSNSLTEGAISEMLRLVDPHSIYMNKSNPINKKDIINIDARLDNIVVLERKEYSFEIEDDIDLFKKVISYKMSQNPNIIISLKAAPQTKMSLITKIHRALKEVNALKIQYKIN